MPAPPSAQRLQVGRSIALSIPSVNPASPRHRSSSALLVRQRGSSHLGFAEAAGGARAAPPGSAQIMRGPRRLGRWAGASHPSTTLQAHRQILVSGGTTTSVARRVLGHLAGQVQAFCELVLGLTQGCGGGTCGTTRQEPEADQRQEISLGDAWHPGPPFSSFMSSPSHPCPAPCHARGRPLERWVGRLQMKLRKQSFGYRMLPYRRTAIALIASDCAGYAGVIRRMISCNRDWLIRSLQCSR
jgi:hypothetical protein